LFANERRRKMTGKSSRKTSPKTKRVRFDFHAPEAQRVSLAGDFNGWNVEALPMRRNHHGTWNASLSLEPGRYEYRFYVDGAWQDDSNAQERVENPFGSFNCVRVVN
jgi:1,4-alpha-glucan branching enzyme